MPHKERTALHSVLVSDTLYPHSKEIMITVGFKSDRVDGMIWRQGDVTEESEELGGGGWRWRRRRSWKRGLH